MKNALSRLLQTNTGAPDATPSATLSFLQEEAAFPLVITAAGPGLSLSAWTTTHRALFDQKLAVHGAVLFRGFQVNTVEKFEQFIQSFNAAPLEYRQRSSPRYAVGRNIYHSTTHPPDQFINMHSENSYARQWPLKIVFCCIQPAIEQGETPIADNRKVLSGLSEATRNKFARHGVRYIRHISEGMGLSWQEVFQTTNREQVEQECRDTGMNYFWLEENSLVLTWRHEAIHRHPVTDEQVWFNHAFFFNEFALDEETRAAFTAQEELPFNTSYGDGSPISQEEIREISAAYAQAAVQFPWEKGDVLFLDNMLMSHGRSPYKGDRQIIVSLFDHHS